MSGCRPFGPWLVIQPAIIWFSLRKLRLNIFHQQQRLSSRRVRRESEYWRAKLPNVNTSGSLPPVSFLRSLLSFSHSFSSIARIIAPAVQSSHLFEITTRLLLRYISSEYNTKLPLLFTHPNCWRCTESVSGEPKWRPPRPKDDSTS